MKKVDSSKATWEQRRKQRQEQFLARAEERQKQRELQRKRNQESWDSRILGEPIRETYGDWLNQEPEFPELELQHRVTGRPRTLEEVLATPCRYSKLLKKRAD